MFIRVPVLVSEIVMTALCGFDSMTFTQAGCCPVCGDVLKIHDFREKVFARYLEYRSEQVIHVRVARYRCQTCRQLVYADEPFYPGTRHGSPVVDLALTLSRIFPLYRTARFMQYLGIRIDRGTIRNYVGMELHRAPAVPLYGVLLPVSIISLSELFAGGTDRLPPGEAEVLTACGLPRRT